MCSLTHVRMHRNGGGMQVHMCMHVGVRVHRCRHARYACMNVPLFITVSAQYGASIRPCSYDNHVYEHEYKTVHACVGLHA